jgi:4-amino-4-deoxy-L-arabinose transferase-like glycosyltransferase
MFNSNSRLILTVVVVCSFLLYAPYLGSTPVYIAADEVFFGLNAHSIAFTGHDINGRFLPLYFQWPAQIAPHVWFQPIIVYFTAVFFRVLPVSEWSIRLPTILVALTDIVLVYLVAKRIFTRERSAVIAAVLFALTPAHLIHSRLAMDFVYPLPFVLAWLLCLVIFLEHGDLRILFAATSFLGVGFYSYIAAVVMMPLYFCMTCLAVFKTSQRSLRPLVVATAGFVWPLLALIPWLVGHFAAVGDTAGRYGLETTLHPGQWGGVTPLLVASAIVERLSLMWRYFDPAYLFVAGGGWTVYNTHRVGVFLFPLMIGVAIGLNEIINFRRTWPNWLLVLGFVTAPVAACLVGEAYAIQRHLFVLPFGVLIATLGLERLASTDGRLPKLIATCCVVLIPLQFLFFYGDYFTQYRVRSAFGSEGNLQGAVEEIIERAPRESSRAVYLSKNMRFIEIYWKLYLLKHGREDLLERTVYFDSKSLDSRAVPRGSLILNGGKNGTPPPALESGKFHSVKLVMNIDRTPCCEILEKIDSESP